MPPRRDAAQSANLDSLREEAARLEREANESTERSPHLHLLEKREEMFMDEDCLFRSEDWNRRSKHQKYLKPKKGTRHFYQRVVNSWSLVEEGTDRLVIPDFAQRNDSNDNRVYQLFGFVNPLNDGARRGSRSLSGFTPLYKRRSHENLWQMQTRLMVVAVKTPYMGHLEFYGCTVPCVIFPSAILPQVVYGVQNPDPNFVPFWKAAVARWAVEEALGNEVGLRPWRDVELAGPRPWYFNAWAMRVLRLEHGLPPTHPDDSPRPAMLGACRRSGPVAQRRAPTTEAEWLAIPTEQCDSGDDEEGDSDAGSINDDVARGLPTSAHWDPETKKSTTPRGTVPHPHPDVVARELERNKRFDDRMGARAEDQERRARRARSRAALAPTARPEPGARADRKATQAHRRAAGRSGPTFRDRMTASASTAPRPKRRVDRQAGPADDAETPQHLVDPDLAPPATGGRERRLSAGSH
ncbi:hypothetical protein FRC08_006890 [Ceratobasidium sp. 394]|nr:hypothetical protein FRC08_006890 [Ceratobasidium sp. 394]